MTFEHILALFGGLALFLYGMHMMSEGLSNAAGDKMRNILEKLTSNRFLGILVGALITAVIQSSSATTVMVVGFVNSGLMTLSQAVWIIMGANVGTTITGQLVALNVGELAPIMAIIGVVFVTFLKNEKLNSLGEILAGLGILFIGMGMMSDAMYPLREEPAFIQLMTTISNPMIAILFGAGFTALIQSSSASVGILQTLALSGLIPLSSSIYIIFGQNIGTCITSVLASISANRMAKRATIIHLAFNLIGTTLFMIAIQFIPFVDWMEAFTDNPAAQIANTHTIFNILTTVILIPFGYKLAKLPEIVLPVLEDEVEVDATNLPLTFVNTNNIGNIPIAIASLKQEALLMLELSQKNINQAIECIYEVLPEAKEKVNKREDRVNFINYEVAEYMSKVSVLHMNEQEANVTNALYKCFADIERISDHAINIVGHGNGKIKKPIEVKEELVVLKDLLNNIFNILMSNGLNEEGYQNIEVYEQKIDDLTSLNRKNQIKRLNEGKIDAADCVKYSQVMTDIERVSDHMINIIHELQNNNFVLKD